MPSLIPFETSVTWQGLEGLQLAKALDQLSPQELSRFDNLYHTGGALKQRPGQQYIAGGSGGSGIVHSIRRLNLPSSSTFTRFWGIGTSWYRGVGGALANLEAGFSGDPLTLVTVRPPQSGEPWMVAADRLKMRKTSATLAGTLGLGLTAPTGMTAVIASILTTGIASFDIGDGTQAANWKPWGGFDIKGVGRVTNPAIGDVTGLQGTAVQMTTIPGSATDAYLSTMVIAKPMNLAVLQGGAVPSTDDDIIHLWLRIALPTRVEEVRLYLVCSPITDSQLAVPGTIPDINTSAYMRAFRPSDFASFVATEEIALEAGQTSADRQITGQQAASPNIDIRETADQQEANRDNRTPDPTVPVSSHQSEPGTPGANLWVEYGTIGLPVRKRDFIKIGTAGDAGTDWSTITGICITVLTTGLSSAVVSFDDCYLTGGYGPDTSEPGSQKYDYRCTHFDPRTGAESNGSPIFADSLWLDALRQAIVLDPNGSGDPGLRQNFYRRGGSITDNWRYVGVNAADGAAFTDTLADLAVVSAGTLPTDHFRPVATVNAAGVTVLNQPVPILFGPFDDGQYCALGDPYRPGHLYGSIPGEVDHWPSTGAYAVEVCPPSEELMNGGVWADQGFVLSRLQGYAVRRNVAGGEGLTVTPTGVQPGLAARWGFCVGPGGIYYVARDGIRTTSGGTSDLLSDQIRPVFYGETVNGYAPIDWDQPTTIRLSLHGLDLWFTYRDTAGSQRTFIFSLIYRYWRAYTFAQPVTLAYQDEVTLDDEAASVGAVLPLYLGSRVNSAYLHAGFYDDASTIADPGGLTPIVSHWRTGSWPFGAPRSPKLLGDLVLEADLKGASISVKALRNVETLTNPTITAGSVVGAGRRRYLLDGAFPDDAQGDPQQAFTVAIDGTIVVEVPGSTGPALTAVPEIAWLGVSSTPLPDVISDRTLTWGTWGSLSDKYLKGFLLDATTYGSTVDVQIIVDGVLARTLQVTHTGRRVAHYSFPQLLGRVFRLQTTSELPSQVYELQPIFDEEPLFLDRWETQLLDFNLPTSGWGSILSADVCYRSLVACQIRVSCYNAEGVLTATLAPTDLPSTAGAKVKTFVPMPANKAVLFKLVFTASAEVEGGPSGMALYQEESRLRVKPWDQGTWILKPFGNDDQDSTRSMVNAAGAAARDGGGT